MLIQVDLHYAVLSTNFPPFEMVAFVLGARIELFFFRPFISFSSCCCYAFLFVIYLIPCLVRMGTATKIFVVEVHKSTGGGYRRFPHYSDPVHFAFSRYRPLPTPSPLPPSLPMFGGPFKRC